MKHHQENSKLIEQYQKDGDLVYELFSILVHGGGAYGGHYFAFIKSFENGKWYRFNDTSITEQDVGEIPEMVFGGKMISSYMLFYRQVDRLDAKQEIRITDEMIPDFVKETLKSDKKLYDECQVKRHELESIITVKIYNTTDVKLVQAKKTDTLNDLMEKAIEQFKIKEKRENIRLRAYRPSTDTKMDTYTGKEGHQLSALNIGHFKVLCIEVKADEDKFEEYISNSTFIRVCLWKQGLQTLSETYIETEKVNVSISVTVYELQNLLAEKYQIPADKLIIIKRHQMHGHSCAEYINVKANYATTLEHLDIYEGSILFIEEKTQEPPKW